VRTLIHERVPARLHGRAFAAYNGIRDFAELFAVVGGGVLIVAIGARWTLFVAGALPFMAGLGGLALYAAAGASRRRRRRRRRSGPRRGRNGRAAGTVPAA
jgi:hypothetical protein